MMATLTLQFENSILKEYEVGLSLTIGRLPDNAIVIDNPAVSGHHACIFRDGDHFVVEDLHSTNGTFVNEKRVNRHTLQHGDAVLVGKHRLVFDQMASGQAAAAENTGPALANLNDTVYLDTKKHKELLTRLAPVKLTQAKTAASATRAGAVSDGPSKIGVLRVVAGRADASQYYLEARTSLIGKSDDALVRLQGWFKPKAAVVITRSGDEYVATRLQGNARINDEPLSGRPSLRDGDVLYVSGLLLEFSWQTVSTAEPAVSGSSRAAVQAVTSTERKIAG
jgi:pSer/pThr/pTyr-binding forkhead associated (FHA) protein